MNSHLEIEVPGVGNSVLGLRVHRFEGFRVKGFRGSFKGIYKGTKRIYRGSFKGIYKGTNKGSLE